MVLILIRDWLGKLFRVKSCFINYSAQSNWSTYMTFARRFHFSLYMDS